MISQLVYTSSPAFDPRSETGQQQVEEILRHARSSNIGNGITGYLLIGPDWMAQVLEGELAIVTHVFRKILRDPRHRDVRLIETRLSPERKFGQWSMGACNGPLHDIPISSFIDYEPAKGQLDFPFDRIIRECLKHSDEAQGPLSA